MARDWWQLWSNYGGWMTWVCFSYMFGFYLFDLDMLLYRDGLSLRERWMIVWHYFVHIRIIVPAVLRLLRIPHSDHECNRHVGSTFYWYIARPWPIWYAFVNVSSCWSCCVAQCCICIILLFLPGMPFFSWLPGARKMTSPKDTTRLSLKKGTPLRRHDMPRCATMPEVLTPIRLLNYTIVGWAVVSRRCTLCPTLFILALLAAAADAGRIMVNDIISIVTTSQH